MLNVCIDVGSCGCPKNSRMNLVGIASWQSMKSAPTSASATDDMTALIICDIVLTVPLLGVTSILLDMKKYSSQSLLSKPPPATTCRSACPQTKHPQKSLPYQGKYIIPLFPLNLLFVQLGLLCGRQCCHFYDHSTMMYHVIQDMILWSYSFELQA